MTESPRNEVRAKGSGWEQVTRPSVGQPFQAVTVGLERPTYG